MKIMKFFTKLVFLFFIFNSVVMGGEIDKGEKKLTLNKFTLLQKEYKEDEYYNTTECQEGAASSHISVSRKYPEISGLEDKGIQRKINQLFKKSAGLEEAEWDYPTTIKVSYEIINNSNGFLSVKFLHNHFVCGANHDTSWYALVNLNLKTGEIYNFKSLFLPEYNKKIDSILKKQLLKLIGSLDRVGRDCNEEHKPEQGLNSLFCLYTINNEKFAYDKNNLFIYFSMYEIGSASIGEPIVTVPLNDVLDIINPKGPLGFALHK